MLTIADEYDLAAGDGVDFHWNTQQAVEITGSQIIVTGKKGTVVITAPSECSARVDDLPLMDGAVQRQIAIHKPGRSGRLEITVKLRSAP